MPLSSTRLPHRQCCSLRAPCKTPATRWIRIPGTHLGQGARFVKDPVSKTPADSTAVFRPSRLLCALVVGDGRPAPMSGRPSPLSLKRLQTICPCSYRSSSRTTVKAGPAHCITQLYSFGNILTYCSNKYLTSACIPMSPSEDQDRHDALLLLRPRDRRALLIHAFPLAPNLKFRHQASLQRHLSTSRMRRGMTQRTINHLILVSAIAGNLGP